MNIPKNIFLYRIGIVISQIMPAKPSLFLYALLSPLLLGLAWYGHMGLLIFFGLVPLLLIEEHYRTAVPRKNGTGFFLLIYFSFLAWNVIVSWWIVNASFGGALMAYLSNALLMSTVFLIYSRLRRLFKSEKAVWLLIPLWISFEYIHTLWDITWTWLSLGNVFAFHTQWIQWYEYTGVTGGSIWILIVNIFCFLIIRENKVRSLKSRAVLVLAALLLVPMLLSRLVLGLSLPQKAKAVNLVVVQPNTDPYNEKFNSSYGEQFLKMLQQVRGKITPATDYLLLPETFITGFSNDLNEDELNTLPEIQLFRDSLLHYFPKLRILTGANTFRFYSEKEKASATARLEKRSGLYYDFYNSAVFITANETAVYHKSKLVPGVEKMPFPTLMKPLENFAINLGGTSGSLGSQVYRTVFKDGSGPGLAPVICYESVYGDFITEYIREGAGIICILTNDGWWDDTPGYRQHLAYAKLRAIECRRPVVRCANTGISCFIEPDGTILRQSAYWEAAVLSAAVTPATVLTFFVRYGDVLAYLCLTVSVLLLISAMYVVLRRPRASN